MERIKDAVVFGYMKRIKNEIEFLLYGENQECWRVLDILIRLRMLELFGCM